MKRYWFSIFSFLIVITMSQIFTEMFSETSLESKSKSEESLEGKQTGENKKWVPVENFLRKNLEKKEESSCGNICKASGHYKATGAFKCDPSWCASSLGNYLRSGFWRGVCKCFCECAPDLPVASNLLGPKVDSPKIPSISNPATNIKSSHLLRELEEAAELEELLKEISANLK